MFGELFDGAQRSEVERHGDDVIISCALNDVVTCRVGALSATTRQNNARTCIYTTLYTLA